MSGAIGDTQERATSVRALEFWKDMKTDDNGPREVHWVRWAKIGDMHFTEVEIEVQRLMKPRSDNGVEMQDPVWVAIKPAYEAWLAGTEAPLDGTPLDAWPALGKRQVKAFREAGYRSVEEVAAIPDSDLPRVKVPDVRKMRDLARGYVENRKGSAHVEAKMAAQADEIEGLKTLVEDMRKALAEASQKAA